MEVDDLDNLIADSLSGVQSVLESERRAAPVSAAATGDAGDVVRELQTSGVDAAADASTEEFFTNLVKTFQDDAFQKSMSEVLQAADIPKPTAIVKSDVDTGVEDLMQGFVKSFENAVEKDESFAKNLTSMMTSMLSNDLICEPLEQIADQLEPWLKSQKGLAAADRSRYESQLKLYRHIISIYKKNPDPLPEGAREEVQRLLAELNALGQPPDEVMQQVTPKEGEDGGESFEDFMKSAGLADGLGAAEQDLLKKLAEDPEELTKVMQEMAGQLGGGKPEEDCKQQ